MNRCVGSSSKTFRVGYHHTFGFHVDKTLATFCIWVFFVSLRTSRSSSLRTYANMIKSNLNDPNMRRPRFVSYAHVHLSHSALELSGRRCSTFSRCASLGWSSSRCCLTGRRSAVRLQGLSTCSASPSGWCGLVSSFVPKDMHTSVPL